VRCIIANIEIDHINNNINYILIYIALSINLICFFLGYFIGKYQIISTDGFISKRDKNKTIKINPNNNIKIDDKKIVVSIDTKGLEKKYDTIGEIKHTEEDISASINKLKNLKR